MGNLLNSSSTDAGLLDDKLDGSRSHITVYISSAYNLVKVFEVVFGCGHQLGIKCQKYRHYGHRRFAWTMCRTVCFAWHYSLCLNMFEQQLKTYNTALVLVFLRFRSSIVYNVISFKCCLSTGYKKLLVLFSAPCKLFRLAVSCRRFSCLSLLSVTQR